MFIGYLDPQGYIGIPEFGVTFWGVLKVRIIEYYSVLGFIWGFPSLGKLPFLAYILTAAHPGQSEGSKSIGFPLKVPTERLALVQGIQVRV